MLRVLKLTLRMVHLRLAITNRPKYTVRAGIGAERDLRGAESEKGEVLLRGLLALRFVSHAQPARLWKAVFYI